MLPALIIWGHIQRILHPFIACMIEIEAAVSAPPTHTRSLPHPREHPHAHPLAHTHTHALSLAHLHSHTHIRSHTGNLFQGTMGWIASDFQLQL